MDVPEAVQRLFIEPELTVDGHWYVSLAYEIAIQTSMLKAPEEVLVALMNPDEDAFHDQYTLEGYKRYMLSEVISEDFIDTVKSYEPAKRPADTNFKFNCMLLLSDFLLGHRVSPLLQGIWREALEEAAGDFVGAYSVSMFKMEELGRLRVHS